MTVLVAHRETRKGPVYTHHVNGGDASFSPGEAVFARMLCGRWLEAYATAMTEPPAPSSLRCTPCTRAFYRRLRAA